MIISMFSPIGIATVSDESPIAGPHSGFPRPTSSPPSKALPRLRSVALPFQRSIMIWPEGGGEVFPLSSVTCHHHRGHLCCRSSLGSGPEVFPAAIVSGSQPSAAGTQRVPSQALLCGSDRHCSSSWLRIAARSNRQIAGPALSTSRRRSNAPSIEQSDQMPYGLD
jgi:hypothetical protein